MRSLVVLFSFWLSACASEASDSTDGFSGHAQLVLRLDTGSSIAGQPVSCHLDVVTPNGQYHVLMHGTTIHGAEKFKNDDGTPVTGRGYVELTGYAEGGQPRGFGVCEVMRNSRASLSAPC